MTRHTTLFVPARRWIGRALCLLLASASLAATAQDTDGDGTLDPPGRVARIGLIEGAVSHAPAGFDEWNAATLNRPLTTGDRLWVAERSRTELHVGSTAVRLNNESSLSFSVLDDDVTQLQLTQGTLSLRVRALFEGQRLQIDTPNLAFSVAEPGEYRIDVDPIRNTTRLSVLGGSGAAYGEGGVPYPLGQRQQVTFAGSNLAQIAMSSVGLRDNFEAWVAERDRREDQLAAARYVSRETIGYQQLDDHGDWANDASYGNVWYPRSVASDWAPYRFGQWVSVAPWGWTWVDDAPWGFAPFHYGRWAYVSNRWGWVPGPLVQRPVYAPALVGFVGGGAGGVNFGFSIGSNSPGVGWFPLAPGEAWRPYHRVSPRYAQRVNRAISANNANAPYRHHRQPHAVTVVNRDTFTQGRPVGHNRYRARPDELARAEVMTGPNIAAPDRRNWRGPGRAATPNAQPPGTVAQREALTDRAAAERAYFRRPAERDRNGDGRDDRDGRAERNDRNDRNDNDGRFRAERYNNPANGADAPGRRAQGPLPGDNPLPPSVAQRWGQQRGTDNTGGGDTASTPPRFVQTPGVPNLRNVTPNLRPVTPNLNNPVDGMDDQRRAAQQREWRQNQANEQAQRDAQRDTQRQAHEQRMQVQTQQLLQRQQQQAQQQQQVQAQQQLIQQQQQAEQRMQQMQQRQQRHPVNVQNTAPPNLQQQPQRGEDRRFGGPRGQGGNRDERR